MSFYIFSFPPLQNHPLHQNITFIPADKLWLQYSSLSSPMNQKDCLISNDANITNRPTRPHKSTMNLTKRLLTSIRLANSLYSTQLARTHLNNQVRREKINEKPKFSSESCNVLRQGCWRQ